MKGGETVSLNGLFTYDFRPNNISTGKEELRFLKRRCLHIQSENTTVDRYHSGRLRKQFRPLGPRPE